MNKPLCLVATIAATDTAQALGAASVVFSSVAFYVPASNTADVVVQLLSAADEETWVDAFTVAKGQWGPGHAQLSILEGPYNAAAFKIKGTEDDVIHAIIR